jgi:hypothetical protein
VFIRVIVRMSAAAVHHWPDRSHQLITVTHSNEWVHSWYRYKGFAQSRTSAPTARDMKARGKWRAMRDTSPLVTDMREQIRPEGPKYHWYYALSALDQIVCLLPGTTRFALAPGFRIPRRWRWPPTLVRRQFQSKLLHYSESQQKYTATIHSVFSSRLFL